MHRLRGMLYSPVLYKESRLIVSDLGLSEMAHVVTIISTHV